MREILLRSLSTAALFITLSGCTSDPAVRDAGYRTLADNPERDAEAARKLNSRAVALIEKKELSEAERLLKDALTEDISFGPAHNNLGRVYYEQGKLYLAAWEFQYAAKLMRFHPEPRNNLGLVFERVGELDDAVTSYGEALELQPDNPELIGNLARARIRRGDGGEELRKLLVELVKKDIRPDWVEWARNRLGTMPHERTAEGPESQ